MTMFALVGAALLSAGPPLPWHFRLCDGYGAPDAVSDGMNSKWAWGYAQEDPPEGIARASWALQACEHALSDPALPTPSRRRASLLRAKTIWQLELGQHSEVLATLAQADAMASELGAAQVGDDFVASNHLLRAYAYFGFGQANLGRAELKRAEAAQPYRYDFSDLAYRIQFSAKSERGHWHDAMRSRARLNPSALMQLFWLSLYQGNSAHVLDLSPQIYLEAPRGRDDANLSGETIGVYNIAEMRADHGGATAYAFAAIGDLASSNTAIERTRTLVLQTRPSSSGVNLSRAEGKAHRLRVMASEHAIERLDHWQRLIAFRAKVPTLNLTQLGQGLQKLKPIGGLVMIDLLRQLRPTDPLDKAEIQEIIAGLERRIDQTLAESRVFSLHDLARRLLGPNTAVAQLRAAGPSFFDDSNGFYVKRDKETGQLNIRYGNTTEAQGPIEDKALLAAAIYTQRAKKDSFLILSRLYVDRQITTYAAYASKGYTTDNGHEARLRILPVNASELPAEHEPSRWRLIRADEVVSRLQPIYMAPPKRKR